MKRCLSSLPWPSLPASPPFSLSSPLHLWRASIWNMAGRKESTIGVLSSDRCPCCAFSTQCEQALGRQPHKTWKNLTCVQKSSALRRQGRMRVQPHVDIQHIYTNKLSLQVTKHTSEESEHPQFTYSNWLIEPIGWGFCWQLFLCSHSASEENRCCYRFNCFALWSFVSTQSCSTVCQRKSILSQFRNQVVIVLVW